MIFFLSVGAIALFSFLAVASWSDSRRHEREAYYKSETLKRFAEMPGDTGLALIREFEAAATRKRLENLKLAGTITAAAGLGVGILLQALVPDEPVYLCGAIPLLVGLALLAYAYVVAPQSDASNSPRFPG